MSTSLEAFYEQLQVWEMSRFNRQPDEWLRVRVLRYWVQTASLADRCAACTCYILGAPTHVAPPGCPEESVWDVSLSRTAIRVEAVRET